MVIKKTRITIWSLFVWFFVSCSGNQTLEMKEQKTENYLLVFKDSDNHLFGYKNTLGEIKIPAIYRTSFTDTLKNFAFVETEDKQLISIDLNGDFMYELFRNYDYAPDKEEYGLFRIVKDGLIGFADFKTGEIVIKPQYEGASQFEGPTTTVAYKCNVTAEYYDDFIQYTMDSKEYLTINKKGNIIEKTEAYSPSATKSTNQPSSNTSSTKSTTDLGPGQYTGIEETKNKCVPGYYGTFQYFKWTPGVKSGSWAHADICFSKTKNGIPKQGRDIVISGYWDGHLFFVNTWKYDTNENNEQRPQVQTFN